MDRQWHRSRRNALLIVLSATLFAGPARAEALPTAASPEADALGAVWVEVPGNPLLPLFDCPDWHCLGHTDPWVARGAGGELVAWFSTGGDLGGPVVGRARVSRDLTLKLDPPDRPVLQQAEGVWDVYRETVSTRWDPDEGRWTMWYLGYAVSFFDDPAIGQARSLDADGAMWERPAEPIYRPAPGGWDFAFVTGPAFVEAPDGQWRLYYAGAGTTVGIGLLLSDDRGATWRPHPANPVLERDLASWDQGMLEPSVLYVEDGDGGRYLMWYAGYQEPLDLATTPISIGLATSPDGVTWTRSPWNPVVGPGAPGTWNDLRVVSPNVVVASDGSLLLFAHGQNRATGIDRALGQLGVWRSPGRVAR